MKSIFKKCVLFANCAYDTPSEKFAIRQVTIKNENGESVRLNELNEKRIGKLLTNAGYPASENW